MRTQPSPTELAKRVAARTVQLGYPLWDWGEGVAWHGVAAAGIRLNEYTLTEAALSWVRSHADVRPSELRHVIPGLVCTTLYEATQDKIALELAQRVADFLAHNPRNVHGAYQESGYIPVWIDYWYEIAPFLTALAKITKDPCFVDWAAEQTFAFILACWDAQASLFHHAYYDLNRKTSQWFWARANGWAMLATVEMLTDLAAVPGMRAILLNILQRHALSLRELQDPSGLWHTVLDQSTTYLEVSASIMVALAVQRGVERGYLDTGFMSAADRAFEACMGHVDGAGNVTNVSAETPPGDIAHYERIPRGVYPWGQGFTILACLERTRAG